MRGLRAHRERHLVHRVGWLRAAVLGANDGIVAVGSLLVGVAASSAGRSEMLVAGIAAWVAGAMSMAAGEYVSVKSQADTEHADLARERAELHANPAAEHRELAQIYVERGVDAETADRVATQLMAHDALGAHARDELGITEMAQARPVVAAGASAMAFTVGAAVPLVTAALAPAGDTVIGVAVASVLVLALLGGVAARAGGAAVAPAVARVAFWGAVAMLVTGGVGRLVGMAV